MFAFFLLPNLPEDFLEMPIVPPKWVIKPESSPAHSSCRRRPFFMCGHLNNTVLAKWVYTHARRGNAQERKTSQVTRSGLMQKEKLWRRMWVIPSWYCGGRGLQKKWFHVWYTEARAIFQFSVLLLEMRSPYPFHRYIIFHLRSFFISSSSSSSTALISWREKSKTLSELRPERKWERGSLGIVGKQKRSRTETWWFFLQWRNPKPTWSKGIWKTAMARLWGKYRGKLIAKQKFEKLQQLICRITIDTMVRWNLQGTIKEWFVELRILKRRKYSNATCACAISIL